MEKGNNDFMTYNLGHDVAKTRLANKLRMSGFDIYAIRKAILNHVDIKFLLSVNAIKMGKIQGQNFAIGCKDSLLSEYQKVNFINNKVTVVQKVNNIVTRILKDFGFVNYGKMEFWKNLDNKYTYNKRIIIGCDILTRNFIKDNYSQTNFTCKLTDTDKNKKYNNWKK